MTVARALPCICTTLLLQIEHTPQCALVSQGLVYFCLADSDRVAAAIQSLPANDALELSIERFS